MLILWTVLITTVTAHKVYESTEDIGPEAFQNVTTLYPISSNKTIPSKENFPRSNNATSNDKVEIDSASKDTEFKDNKDKLDATVWKIEAAFAEPNPEKQEKENNTNVQDVTDKKSDTKTFRPSPQLGSFFDDDIVHVTPIKSSFESFMPLKKPTSGFVSSISDDHHSFNKIPKQIFQTHNMYPYKFEKPILTRFKEPWKAKGLPGDSLESRPTVEAPVRLPAGGLYKYQDPFKETPGSEQHDDFGLEFTDGKDNPIKKRENPWESLLRLVTAFLPVGLIISALTPSIITVENTGVDTSGHTYPSNLYRRTDPVAAALPAISERCRRRLLCELHSDVHYRQILNSPQRRSKQCYKIRCEDTEALARTLKFLLEYRQYTTNGPYK